MNKGVLSGICAYLIWGFLPIYLKALQVVPSLQIMLHRIVWSFIFVMLVIVIRREWQRFKSSIFKLRNISSLVFERLTWPITAVS